VLNAVEATPKLKAELT